MMEFQKNGKRGKNGVRQDEQLLINYSGGEQPSESDSDRVKPLELPPTRLRRPKSRKIRVSSSNSKSVFSLWNFCQVLFVIVVIGTMVCMVWFTVVLKTSLDNMKKRVSILETSDRSTSKECSSKAEELQKKVEALRGTAESLVSSDEKHFKSLLLKIQVLNKTVDSLKERLKSPKSVSSIHYDISLLKKAMADSGREMTEVTDKVTQLRRIAHLQNTNIKHMKVQIYNVTVQLAKLAGQPTPKPVTNTGTPPWLLRVPAESDSQSKSEFSQVELDKMRQNITSHMKKDIGKIVAYVKRANKSVHKQVYQLQEKLSSLTKNFSKQKALMDRLTKTKHTNTTRDSKLKHDDDSVDREISNLTTVLDTLTSQFISHSVKFDQLTMNVASINQTLQQREYNRSQTAVSSCNCTLEGVWKAIGKDEENIKDLQSKLDEVHKSIEYISQKEVSTATPTLPKEDKTTSKLEQRTTSSTTEVEHGTPKPTTTTKQPTTVDEKSPTIQEPEKGSTSAITSQTTPTTTLSPSKDSKRMVSDDDDEESDDDLESWSNDNSDADD